MDPQNTAVVLDLANAYAGQMKNDSAGFYIIEVEKLASKNNGILNSKKFIFYSKSLPKFSKKQL